MSGSLLEALVEEELGSVVSSWTTSSSTSVPHALGLRLADGHHRRRHLALRRSWLPRCSLRVHHVRGALHRRVAGDWTGDPLVARVAMRYYRRRWNETRGDAFSSWGGATYYFEVGEDGWPTRQVEVYDAGPACATAQTAWRTSTANWDGPGWTDSWIGRLGNSPRTTSRRRGMRRG